MTTTGWTPKKRSQLPTVPVDAVIVGARRRVKLGNIKSLAHSIAIEGLLHPIVVRTVNGTGGVEVVAGQRRLEACRRLGWKTIAVMPPGEVADDALRAAELAENRERLDFDDYEASKQRLRDLLAEEAKRLESEGGNYGATCTESPPHRATGKAKGRPKKPGSKRDVEEQTGVSRRERQRIEEHVRLAEEYLVLQGAGWRKAQVLSLGAFLETLPKKDRKPAIGLLQMHEDQLGEHTRKVMILRRWFERRFGTLAA